MKEELRQKHDIQSLIDRFEESLLEEKQVECPLQHVFTPGLYTRQILIPKGTYLTSKIHNTEHPFVVTVGKVSVYTEEDGEVIIEAPFMGITKPGTRRVLFAHETTVWTTFHPTEKTDLEEIENDIIDNKRKEIKQ